MIISKTRQELGFESWDACVLTIMDLEWSQTARKRPHWESFTIGQTVFS